MFLALNQATNSTRVVGGAGGARLPPTDEQAHHSEAHAFVGRPPAGHYRSRQRVATHRRRLDC